MRRAVEALKTVPTLALIDGNRCPVMKIQSIAVIGGDDKVDAISAASILAKTARDAALVALHEKYPHYCFDQHKGYGTALHMERLREHGASPVHRRSFAPVREVLELHALRNGVVVETVKAVKVEQTVQTAQTMDLLLAGGVA
jgi:ribonuclease HII